MRNAFGRRIDPLTVVLSAGCLLLALANPALLEEERESLSDVAIVLVDRSPSQKIGERAPAVPASGWASSWPMARK